MAKEEGEGALVPVNLEGHLGTPGVRGLPDSCYEGVGGVGTSAEY